MYILCIYGVDSPCYVLATWVVDIKQPRFSLPKSRFMKLHGRSLCMLTVGQCTSWHWFVSRQVRTVPPHPRRVWVHQECWRICSLCNLLCFVNKTTTCCCYLISSMQEVIVFTHLKQIFTALQTHTTKVQVWGRLIDYRILRASLDWVQSSVIHAPS